MLLCCGATRLASAFMALFLMVYTPREVQAFKKQHTLLWLA